eukprot:3486695-Amphidinium_carterae.1
MYFVCCKTSQSFWLKAARLFSRENQERRVACSLGHLSAFWIEHLSVFAVSSAGLAVAWGANQVGKLMSEFFNMSQQQSGRPGKWSNKKKVAAAAFDYSCDPTTPQIPPNSK